MTGYSVSIKETSMELSAKARIQIKDTTGATPLDKATQESAVVINPEMYAILDIHNEKSDDKDYVSYVIVDKDGTRYTTGSESFFSSFMNIWNEMKDSTEDWAIKAYRLPSKNRQGKDFLTCSVI